MARPSLVPALALLSACVYASGCAPNLNYLDPAGPRYEATVAAPTDPTACADPTRPFTAVTFNIEHARRIDEAIDVLRSQANVRDADVLMLQEMSPAGVARIAEALSLNYLYFPSGVHPRSRQDFGTAVFSRWSIEDGRKILLPYAASFTSLRRAVTQATLRCGTQRIVVMTLHLPAALALSEDHRRQQVETILAHAKTIADPLIIAGDFNASWVGSLFEHAGFVWVSKDLPGTAAALWMRKKYDHVFVRGLVPAAGYASAGVGDAQGSSDHQPMWARLRIPPAEPPQRDGSP